SATLGGLCHKASARPLTRPSRLSATRLTDNYLGGTSTHWRSAPLGRTQHSRFRGLSPFIFIDIPASPPSFPQRSFVFNTLLDDSDALLFDLNLPFEPEVSQRLAQV